MTPRTVQTMLLVGGHPVLDFVNTVDSRIGKPGPDYLGTFGDLLVWARRTGMIDLDEMQRKTATAIHAPDLAERALVRAKTLREALFSLCLAEASSGAVDEKALGIFNDALSMAQANRRVTVGQNALQWDWRSGDTLDLVTERVAIAAGDLLVERTADRRPIRQCPGHNCGWLFLDTSRGGRRQWCSDKTCGTRERVKRFRADKTSRIMQLGPT